MKLRLLPFVIASLFFNVLYSQTVVSVSTPQKKHQISRHIYGHFAEHLGRCVYGGFYIGDSATNIPNINGVRKDIIAALKNLQIPNLRWPGGCFADTYHWKDGIGPKEKRPSIVNTWWGGVTENNSFGTHEFLNMCEELGTEAYLAANVGSGTVQELIDWVQYVNFEGKSPMSDLRREHGRDKPWNVRFWGIGNEAWGCGGNMTPEYYSNLFRLYSTFLTGWSNDRAIWRIASGANSSDYNWTEVLMKNIPHNMLGGLALHHYSVIDWNKKGPATGFTEEQYFTTMKRALYMDTLLRKHIAIMDKYDPQGKVPLIVDEWGGWYDVEPGTNPGFLYQQNTMRDAMIAGVTLNLFNNYCERVKMANLAQTVNVLQAVILTQEEKMILTPTYHVMEMYKVHQDGEKFDVKVGNATYVHKNEKLPAISCSASRDSLGRTHLTLVNIDASKAQDIRLELEGSAISSAKARILVSSQLSDHNSFEQPEKIKPVEFRSFTTKGNTISLKLPPFSVVAIELQHGNK